MCKDHDDVAIGNAGIVQGVGNGVGRLIDLAVGECPGRRPGPNVRSLVQCRSGVCLSYVEVLVSVTQGLSG